MCLGENHVLTLTNQNSCHSNEPFFRLAKKDLIIFRIPVESKVLFENAVSDIDLKASARPRNMTKNCS